VIIGNAKVTGAMARGPLERLDELIAEGKRLAENPRPKQTGDRAERPEPTGYTRWKTEVEYFLSQFSGAEALFLEKFKMATVWPWINGLISAIAILEAMRKGLEAPAPLAIITVETGKISAPYRPPESNRKLKKNQKPVTKESAIAALNLFEERAADLEKMSFWRSVFDEPSGVKHSWDRDTGLTTERFGPTDEARNAFCLTFRMFIQENEPCSFQNLERVYQYFYDEGYISQRDYGYFQSVMAAIAELKEPISDVPIIVNGISLTPWYILDTVIYGDLSHSNEKKRAVFKHWRSIEPLFPLIMNEFVRTLADMINAIIYARGLNTQILSNIPADGAGT
jgi:hypothetical protein